MSFNKSNIEEQQRNIHLADDQEQPNPDKIWEDVIGLLEQREAWCDRTKYQGYDKTKFVNKMKDIFTELYYKTPTIFEKCCDGDFENEDEVEKLEYMLDMTRELRKNPSKKNYDNVTKKVGERFADEYVNPVLNKLNEDKKIVEED